MTSHWTKIKIGDFLTFEYGKPLEKSKRKDNGLYPAYGANGIKCRSDEFYFDKRTIIVGRKGSAGEITLTEERFWPLDVTYFVKFDDSKYDLMFVYYLLNQLYLPSMATGVKPGINRNNVYAIEVWVPEILEQKRIVRILDKVFSSIATVSIQTEQNLKNARELLVSFLYQLFSRPGADWVESELFDYVKFIDYRGKTPKKTENGLRLITAKNVRMGFLRKEPMEYVDPESYDEWMTRGIPQKGDVLFTTEAPLANVTQLDTDERVVFAQRIITMQPDRSKIDSDFLKYLLMSHPVQKRIHEKGTGATATGIKASLLKKIRIEFPDSIAEQVRYVAILDQLMESVTQLEEIYTVKLEKLDELKKSILQRAFTGSLTKDEGEGVAA